MDSQGVNLEWGIVLVIISEPICAREYKLTPNTGTDNYTRTVSDKLIISRLYQLVTRALLTGEEAVGHLSRFWGRYNMTLIFGISSIT